MKIEEENIELQKEEEKEQYVGEEEAAEGQVERQQVKL